MAVDRSNLDKIIELSEKWNKGGNAPLLISIIQRKF
jgi:hypothetical protein